MDSQQQSDSQITKRALREAGFYQIEKDSFTNGIFDLILSDEGVAVLFVQDDTKSISCIVDLDMLKSYVNYHIISSVGVCIQ